MSLISFILIPYYFQPTTTIKHRQNCRNIKHRLIPLLLLVPTKTCSETKQDEEKKTCLIPDLICQPCSWPQAETCCGNLTTKRGWCYVVLSLWCWGSGDFQFNKTRLAMTNLPHFRLLGCSALAWWMFSSRDRENRACCYWWTQLITPHTTKDTHTQHPAHCFTANRCPTLWVVSLTGTNTFLKKQDILVVALLQLKGEACGCHTR